MATYLIANEITITRQEGDTADIEFELDEVLDISTLNPYFSVQTYKGIEILTKEPADFLKIGQELTCFITEEDTKGKAGNYRWELELVNGSTVITVGRGDFIIVKELITETRH